MGSLGAGLLDGIRGAYCSNLRSQPQWWGNLRDTLTPSPLKEAGNFVNDWICGDGEDTFPPPPFSGGQCPVAYLVRLVNTSTTAPFPSSGEAFVAGPVGGLQVTPGVQPGTINVIIKGNPDSGFRTGNSQEEWSISSVSRVDGQPDNCGDPEPELPPPAPINVDVDITYGPTNNLNLTVPVIFAPVYVALDGTVNVPVTVNFSPDFSLDGTLELFPDFSLDLNFPGVGGGPGDSQPNPEPPPDDPDGSGEPGEDNPDTPEDDEPNQNVYSLLCRGRIESNASPSGIFQQIGPDIYAPRLGSARFGTVIEGVTFWSEDIDIKGLNSVVQCPIPWGASQFVVNAAPGVVLNYVPVSSPPKDWPPTIQLGTQYTSDNR